MNLRHHTSSDKLRQRLCHDVYDHRFDHARLGVYGLNDLRDPVSMMYVSNQSSGDFYRDDFYRDNFNRVNQILFVPDLSDRMNLMMIDMKSFLIS